MRKYIPIVLVLSLLLSVPAVPLHKQTTAQEEIEFRFEMMVLSWDDFSVYAGEAIAEQLEAIGIKVEVLPLDDSVMYPRLEKRDYQVEEMSYGFDPIPVHLYYRFHSSQDYEGGANEWSYHNPQVDQLLEQAFSTSDREKARQLLFQVQQILAEEVPYIPLYLSNDVHPFAKGWTNWTIMPAGPINWYNRWTPIYIYNTEGKDTFVVRYPSAPEPLSPMVASNGRALWYCMNVYDSLLTYDPEFNLVPWLAESWEISEDGKTITFHLRHDAKWHDGEPVTSKDVAFTFNYIKEKQCPGALYMPDIIRLLDYVETPDDYTVVVHIKEPYLFAVDAFGLEYIIPEHIWKDIEDPDWDPSMAPQYAIGSGPFKFVEYVPGEYLILERFEDWWGKKPNVKRIIIRIIDNDEASLLAIKAGEVSTERYGVMPAYVERVRTDPDLQVVETVDQWDYLIAFNNKIWPFNITKVRQAIAYAINREDIVEKVMGAGTVTETFVPSVWFGTYWENPNVKKYEYNPEKAKQLLAEVGFRDIDNDGVLEYAPEVEVTPPPSPSPSPTPAPAKKTWMYGLIILIIIIAVVAYLMTRKK